MVVPIPTKVYRIMHVDSLRTCLLRRALYAPKTTPNDSNTYRPIHNKEIQGERHLTTINCGPRGCMHDYVPFYFGPLSPMLLQLNTGQVQGYTDDQIPIIYLVTTAQRVEESGTSFVFSDGHGIAAFTIWYDSLSDLDKVDWRIVNQRYWTDTLDDNDRQRRKQAEFLIHDKCNWDLIRSIAVINCDMQQRVSHILSDFPDSVHKPVVLKPDWYYY